MEQIEGKLSLILGYHTVTMLQRLLLILLLVYTTQVVGQNMIPEFRAYGVKSEGEYSSQIFVKDGLQFSPCCIRTMLQFHVWTFLLTGHFKEHSHNCNTLCIVNVSLLSENEKKEIYINQS